jgi:hypothetical protein
MFASVDKISFLLEQSKMSSALIDRACGYVTNQGEGRYKESLLASDPASDKNSGPPRYCINYEP